MIFWIWVLAILIVLVLYYRRVYFHFSRYGVKNPKAVPFLGNMTMVSFRQEHFANYVERIYNSFPGERFVGTYEFTAPVLNIRDPELIKKITVKDFEHFLDHRQFFSEEQEPILARSLVALKGQEWKEMRATLSPAFTSSKMRNMVPFMVEVGEQMIGSLKKKIQVSNDGYIDIDVKDMTTRYANDVIASCAFGLKVDSHTFENNQFYEMGKALTSFSFLQIIVMFFNLSFPKLMKILNVTIRTKNIQNFIRDLVLGTMKNREKHNIVRPDMIHLLMEAKKGQLKHDDVSTKDTDAGFATVEESSVGKNEIIKKVWTDDDFTAQAAIFLLAGFETVSTAMTFLVHELIKNPDVQDKLVQEIRQNDIKNNGKFDYNSIQQMPYLDMVISEVLRLWPSTLFLDRYCTRDYNIGRPNDKATTDYIIRKGEAVIIPMRAIHHDPKYFPDPFKFIPERFSEENKHKIKPFTYMPFGLGPRNCIGSRFALSEIKVMTYMLLKNMELSPNEKTQLGNELTSDSVSVRLKNGHWARLRVRT